VVRVHHGEDLASHIGLEPCVSNREVVGEASAEEWVGQPLSHESQLFRGADAVGNAEGNIGGAYSRAPCLTRRGRRTWHAQTLLVREPGDLWLGHLQSGPHREGEEPKPMMHGHEKSDSAIVAMKPPNKAGRPAAEAVERRAEAKENANRCRTCRTQCRESVSPTPERVRKAEASRQTSEVGAVCRKAARTVLCGLRLASASNSAA